MERFNKNIALAIAVQILSAKRGKIETEARPESSKGTPNYFSTASTPGNVPLSIYSNNAPPPVET